MQKYRTNLRNSWRVVRNDYRKFETDPATQLRYHRRMTIFWLLNFPFMNIVVGVDIYATLTNHMAGGLLLTAVLLAINTNYSLYANLDTEMGDAHGAYASLRADQLANGESRFSNPNYRPPNTQTIAAVSTPPAPSGTEALPGSLGLGWNDQDNAGMESAGVADF